MSHRRRALLLGGLALVLGGLAAFNVAGREAALERRVGDLVDIVVARQAIAAGDLVPERALAIRQVPRRFAPAGTTGLPQALIGRRAAVDIPPDTDLTAGMIVREDGAPTGPPVEPGERVAEVVALGSPDLVVAGSRVDVLVTPEPLGGGTTGEAVLALENVEVIGATAVAADDAPASKGAQGARVAASLRVTLRQAVYLAAAQDFARELRLLPRAGGDRKRGHAGLRLGAQLP
ncbi:MAG: SAF domain-containing protein [Solirubrobacteraceae bacterium]|nr:SAF domain-containing protein [Solirubrobacteraceae bacterium]